MRLTADHQPIVFHDVDARRLCGSPLEIGRSEWKDLKELSVAGHAIVKLGNLLDFVDGKASLLLEVKVNGDLRHWLSVLKRELSSYRGRYGIMSFDPRLLRLAKGGMPRAPTGLLIEERRSFLERLAYLQIAKPDFLAVELGALQRPWVIRERHFCPIYGWTIRTAKERAQAGVQADSLIWEADGRPRI